MRVDFDYLMKQVKAGKVKRPWRRMSARQMKKCAYRNFDYEDLFILATAAKVGDVYHEHEENHRICEIVNDDPDWVPAWVEGSKVDRFARRARIKTGGYFVNEMGKSVCGCNHLALPVSPMKAAELELMNCLPNFDIDRLRRLQKKYAWYKSEASFLEQLSWHEKTRDNPEFALYVDWAKRTARIYDADGPFTIVDEDGVLLESYRKTKSEIWQMCWSAVEEEGKQ